MDHANQGIQLIAKTMRPLMPIVPESLRLQFFLNIKKLSLTPPLRELLSSF